MLNHTKKIKELYEDIQKKIFYMIPEKWERFYLYCSIIDNPKNGEKGELFFYYIPRGIFRKNPVNVYEIPTKFNLDEESYLKLVEILYQKIKELRNELKKSERNQIWSNMTIIIENLKFKVEYNYEDLENSDFTSYERHIIWRYKYLGIGMEQVSRKDKEILKRYISGAKNIVKQETYETGIYIKNIENIVDYNTENYDTTQNVEYIATKNKNKKKNQILLSEEELKEEKIKKEI